jgi:hypothetical protein
MIDVKLGKQNLSNDTFTDDNYRLNETFTGDEEDDDDYTLEHEDL